MSTLHDADAAAEAIATLFESSTRAVAMTGAGVSAASGVPTYRGAGGSWTRYDPAKYASIDYFREDPTYYWCFFRDERYPAVAGARPNPAHRALADLERDGHLQAVITQNIDGLHQEGGSERVLELHGNTRRYLCQACDAVHDIERVFQAIGEAIPPACPACDSPSLRPDVVLFGEGLPEAVLSEAFALSQAADLVLVVGSSLVVQPAAYLPLQAVRGGGALVILNLDRTPLDPLARLLVRAPAHEVLPRVVAALGAG